MKGDAHRLPPCVPRSLYDALFRTEPRTVLTIFTIVTIVGVVVGLTVPGSDASEPEPWKTLSSVIGWIYFSAWSISFWPQVLLNWQRRSVEGLSFDFIFLNFIGFSCYTAYNCGLAWSPAIRDEYMRKFPGTTPKVQPNDVFFALHAVLLTGINIAQIAVYDRGGQRVSYLARAILAVLVALIGGGAALCATGAGGLFTYGWLDYLTFLSYVKLAITLMKYTPQVVLNIRRKSTLGWTIHNVLLDFTGGTLSVVQLLIDCAATGDWAGAEGDPVKFGLGFTSMVFDVVFMAQHYCLYPNGGAAAARGAGSDGGGAGGEDEEAYDVLISGVRGAENAKLLAR